MPPGITGLWQVKGRSDLGFQEMVQLDIFYVQSWSVWLDLKILLLTLPAVLKGLSRLKGAVALASSEQVSAATFTTVEPEKATAMLADLDEQIAALRRLRKAVRAALK